jgi:hypothetical protein
MKMKIDEFMGIVNRVAYVKRRNMRIDIYSSGNNYYGDWFLSINPHQEDLNIGYNWKYLDLEPNKLITVITAVAKLKATPVKERFPEKKYTVQVFPADVGYLNLDDDGCIYTDDLDPFDDTRTQFSKQDIDSFKQRDDIAIDWNKAKIEEVKGR